MLISIVLQRERKAHSWKRLVQVHMSNDELEADNCLGMNVWLAFLWCSSLSAVTLRLAADPELAQGIFFFVCVQTAERLVQEVSVCQ